MLTPKDAILFKIVHTCAIECLILMYIICPESLSLYAANAYYCVCFIVEALLVCYKGAIFVASSISATFMINLA